jgi:hypothetical protein
MSINFNDMTNLVSYLYGSFKVAKFTVKDFRKNLDFSVVQVIVHKQEVPLHWDGEEIGRLFKYDLFGSDVTIYAAILDHKYDKFMEFMRMLGVEFIDTTSFTPE